ncbi:hypothetical protein KP509_09G078400 [Ceratopteris richardii]|uniref:Uncharacterized protein n=1 Tax=Ceratopteris richardii TaxID=49495 RepID=A0A8T2U8U9_CERRI|nr:hypothetical protein KP509_09G078400 [Ceratopteris richardii]
MLRLTTSFKGSSFIKSLQFAIDLSISGIESRKRVVQA